MSDIGVMIGVAVVAFVSTNLDNLFLLMALLSGAERRTAAIVIGYASAIALVLAVAVAASLVADIFSDTWLRFLGLIPLTMGIWRARHLARGFYAEPAASIRPATGAFSVFAVMLANSGDSLGVFASLLSETSEPLILVAIATSLAMACLWVAAARWVVEHPSLAPHLHRLDRILVPILLIAVGLYILTDTATDTV